MTDPMVQAQIIALKSVCREIGAKVTGDDMVRQPTAARLLGFAQKTLSNDRAGQRRWRVVKRGRTVFYPLADLAQWLVENAKDE
ncbi:hypothetical protein [Caenibius sp. WL]|uniref:hypothetical protein n=1 Tax=Caenibius sp. WL TaxID=2872646 RepID=UPI001C995A9D|nr:hypothetical protein [Caenibius sp. WL]QZP08191.1 hypothetical protein K5X80_16420 [Caenibius sp. WL]